MTFFVNYFRTNSIFGVWWGFNCTLRFVCFCKDSWRENYCMKSVWIWSFFCLNFPMSSRIIRINGPEKTLTLFMQRTTWNLPNSLRVYWSRIIRINGPEKTLTLFMQRTTWNLPNSLRVYWRLLFQTTSKILGETSWGKVKWHFIGFELIYLNEEQWLC